MLNVSLTQQAEASLLADKSNEYFEKYKGQVKI